MHRSIRATARLLTAAVLVALTCAPSLAQDAESAAPKLLVLPPMDELMLVRHARPLSPMKAGMLAAFVGPFVAFPVVRSRASGSVTPLPASWRTDQPDRGFAAALTAALESRAGERTWSAVQIVGSGEEIDRFIDAHAGEDIAVALVNFELVNLPRDVQFSTQTQVTMLYAAGTAAEKRARTEFQEVSRPIPVARGPDAVDGQVFAAAGPLDRGVQDVARWLADSLAGIVGGPPP